MLRWGARIVGLLMLIIFVLMMMNLHKRLRTLEETRPAATSTAPAE
ncbi:MAG: hypothetical protein WA208_12835 [Thermoanaerobaculia bacterium]